MDRIAFLVSGTHGERIDTDGSNTAGREQHGGILRQRGTAGPQQKPLAPPDPSPREIPGPDRPADAELQNAARPDQSIRADAFDPGASVDVV